MLLFTQNIQQKSEIKYQDFVEITNKIKHQQGIKLVLIYTFKIFHTLTLPQFHPDTSVYVCDISTEIDMGKTTSS